MGPLSVVSLSMIKGCSFIGADRDGWFVVSVGGYLIPVYPRSPWGGSGGHAGGRWDPLPVVSLSKTKETHICLKVVLTVIKELFQALCNLKLFMFNAFENHYHMIEPFRGKAMCVCDM